MKRDIDTARLPLKINRLLVLVFLLGSLASHGQGIQFDYDAGGNRIKRHIPSSSRLVAEALQTETDSVAVKDIPDEEAFYPNPTDGLVHFFVNDPDVTQSRVSIVELNGRLMQEAEFEEQEFALNLRDLPNGIYLVRWQMGSEVRTAKIIKQ